MRTILLACVALIGCSRSYTSDRANTTTTTAADIDTMMARPPDMELIRIAEIALAAEPDLSIAARNVEIDVIDGIMTFKGSVPDLETKAALNDIAKRVPALEDVLNKVEVTSSRNDNDLESDDTIAFSLQRSLYNDVGVRSEADYVTIDVVHGVVTLRGSTTNPDTRTAVERIVETTPGVVVVSNQLRVAPGV